MSKSIQVGGFFFVPQNEQQEFEDLRAALKTQPGRRVFRRLLDATNTLGTSMASDTRRVEYNEGLRAVGLWLATQIEAAAPGELARLITESTNDRLAENTRLRRTEDDG